MNPKYQMPEKIKSLRRSCITGTDIGAITGVNPYKTAMDVWMEKKKMVDINLWNERIEAGMRLENTVAEWYSDETGIALAPCEFIKEGIYGGSPDRLPVDEKYNDLVIEIKTADGSRRNFWGEEGTDQVPSSYLVQCAWYMMLTNRARCDLAVLIGGNDFRIYKIQRNLSLEGKLKAQADWFWQKFMIKGETPSITYSDNFKVYLSQTYKKGNGIILEAEPELYEKAKRLHEVNSRMGSLKKEKDTLESQFKHLIGQNEGISGDGFQYLWPNSKDSKDIDYDGLIAELAPAPEIIEKHTRIKPGARRTNFKFTEQESCHDKGQ